MNAVVAACVVQQFRLNVTNLVLAVLAQDCLVRMALKLLVSVGCVLSTLSDLHFVCVPLKRLRTCNI